MKWLLIGCLLGADVAARAGAFSLESAGARGGFSANKSGKDFNQAEAFLNANLPWSPDLGRNWDLQTRLDLSIGWLGDRVANAAISTLGPTLLLKQEGLPLSLEGGLSPTLLSQHDFETKDFGVKIQFTTHVGINWDFLGRFRLSYRFQHMSNARLSHHNPGLNLHMFGVSYLF